MTATASTNTNGKKKEKQLSPALHNWRQNVLGDKKLFIILAVLHLIAAPAVMLAMIISVYTGQKDIDAYGVIGTMTTALAGFLGIFPAVDSFSCLHNKSVVDMRLSLPLNAKQRFFSNYFSGLFTYIAPFLGAQVVSLLLTGYGLIFMEGRTFYHEYVGADGVLEKVPFVCDYFTYAAPMLLKLILCGLLAMLMLYTVTVLITVCCGSKFESIAYTILINAVLPLTVVCVTNSIFGDLYGIEPYAPMYRLIAFTTVAGGIFFAIDWAAAGGGLLGTVDINPAMWTVVFLIITAAIGALAFFLYGKRRAEQVSKPFVFKLVYYVIITCAMFCLVSTLLTDSTVGLIPAIIITAIVYMIFEVVTNRGFKRFWVSIIKYAFTFLAAFAVVLVGDKTGGFGAVTRIPSESSVVSVEIGGFGYTGVYGLFSYADSYFRDYNYYGGNDSYDALRAPIVFSDKESIKAVLDAHRAMIDFYTEYGETDRFSSYATVRKDFNIRYHLTGGRTLERSYSFYDAQAMNALARLDLTEEYKSAVAEKYKNIISRIPEMYKSELEYNRENNKEEFYPGQPKVYEAYSHTWFADKETVGVSMDYLCGHGFYEQLAEAYAKDIMAMNEENYYNSDLRNIWTVYLTGDMYCASAYIKVPESFVNTVELLKYFDFDLRRIEDASDEEISAALMSHTAVNRAPELFTVEEFRNINRIDASADVLSAPCLNSNKEYYVYDFNKDVCDIVRGSLPMHIADENGYIISIYGTSYSVPAELADTAKHVPRSARNKELEDLYDEIVRGASSDSTYAY